MNKRKKKQLHPIDQKIAKFTDWWAEDVMTPLIMGTPPVLAYKATKKIMAYRKKRRTHK